MKRYSGKQHHCAAPLSLHPGILDRYVICDQQFLGYSGTAPKKTGARDMIRDDFNFRQVNGAEGFLRISERPMEFHAVSMEADGDGIVDHHMSLTRGQSEA